MLGVQLPYRAADQAQPIAALHGPAVSLNGHHILNMESHYGVWNPITWAGTTRDLSHIDRRLRKRIAGAIPLGLNG